MPKPPRKRAPAKPPAPKNLNRSLHAAKATKQDEFYTQLPDIEKELKHYTKHFAGKTVLCNCDDPKVSNFFRYFSRKFHDLKLKRLITTCYRNADPDLFSQNESGRGLRLIYSGELTPGGSVPGFTKLDKKMLDGDGDFRSKECIALLKEADIVVTNPPFSLFREYVAQLVESGKKFIIIGNHNAITYREIFTLIRDNRIWLGNTHPVAFVVPDHYEMRGTRSWRDENGTNWRSLGNACWFTNLDIAKRHEDLTLYKTFDKKAYPKFDNYDAVEVSAYKNIPMDFDGVMGVPVTFLEHHNPEQFEIIGLIAGNIRGLAGIPSASNKDGPYINGRLKYGRILIRRKKQSK
ncbi:MAG: adenine-specific methyltransferase EcoRI family protein [Phycisphaeraceae bacterium]|nr:MAG: adenine-specific methyltransferase EcoRI family protein [Phycisphaeraceae bacterium]